MNYALNRFTERNSARAQSFEVESLLRSTSYVNRSLINGLERDAGFRTQQSCVNPKRFGSKGAHGNNRTHDPAFVRRVREGSRRAIEAVILVGTLKRGQHTAIDIQDLTIDITGCV